MLHHQHNFGSEVVAIIVRPLCVELGETRVHRHELPYTRCFPNQLGTQPPMHLLISACLNLSELKNGADYLNSRHAKILNEERLDDFFEIEKGTLLHVGEADGYPLCEIQVRVEVPSGILRVTILDRD